MKKIKDWLMKNKNNIYIMSICVLAASMPLFMNYFIFGDDLIFHLNRIEAMYEGIKTGMFPVKLHSVWINDYGYPVGVFYGDWLLYIPVFFKIMGLSIMRSYQLFVVLINLFTVVVSYYSFKRLFSSSNLGILGAVIYTLSLYRLENIFSRAAVGEYCAMIFFPLIFVGMYEILMEKRKTNSISPVILLSLGFTGLIHSHILSCLIVALFIIISCILFYRKLLKIHVLRSLISVLFLTLLLSLDFIIPFMDYYLQNSFNINSDGWGQHYIQEQGLFFSQIFSVFVKPRGGGWSTSQGVANETTFSLGFPVIIGILLYVYSLINIEKKTKRDGIGIYSFSMFWLAVFMMSSRFPWNVISDINLILESLIKTLQFPWRLLSVACLFSTIFICVALRDLKKYLVDELKYIPVFLIGVAIIVSVSWYSNTIIFDEEYGAPLFYDVNDEEVSKYIYTGEYLPEGTNVNLLIHDKIQVSDNVWFENYSREGFTVNCNVFSNGCDGYIEFPLLFYKGYFAKDSNTGQDIKVISGENNVVRVLLPNNYNGNIEVKFQEPILWRIGELITVFSFGVLFVYIIIFMCRKCK